MTYIHHYHITQNIVTALKIIYPLLICISLPPPLDFPSLLTRPLISLLSPSPCLFPNAIELQSYIMKPFQTDFFHLVTCI